MRPEALALLLLASPAMAEGLDGRAVLFRAEVLDAVGSAVFASSDYAGRVGAGPEFGMLAEATAGFAVVPVTVDLAADRIDLSYAGTVPGAFTAAPFNGYVLTFPAECTLLTGAAVDAAATTLPLTDAALTVEPQALRIDVAGLRHGPADRIGIRLTVTDCLLG